jgi:hypothetical protein
MIWCGILVLASVNGALRDLVIAPRIGDTAARAVSTLILAGLVLLVTWLSVRWIGPRTVAQTFAIGALWCGLTLLFEFGFGHYVMRRSWAFLLADYDLTRGRIWILVLIVTLVAPAWTGRLRRLFRSG